MSIIIAALAPRSSQTFRIKDRISTLVAIGN